MACLNAYIGVRRFDIIVELIPQLLKQIPEHRETLLRNLATSYRELGNNEEQFQTLKTLLEEFPMNDVNHYLVFGYLHKLNQDQQAFYHLELASALDPNDINHLHSLAGAIFDDQKMVR